MIDLAIKHPVLNQQLKQITDLISHYSYTVFYMDGLLFRFNDISSIIKIDLRWINALTPAATFQAFTTLWPSSIKAKILACLTALLTVTFHTKVTFYTDSQATIDDYHLFRNPHLFTFKKCKKSLNFTICILFNYIVNSY